MDIRDVISKLTIKEESLANLRYAGACVLFGFIEKHGKWNLLLEKRALDLDVQPGEMCLPGGKREEGETPKETVIRETMEELCISEDDIEILREIGVASGPGGWKIGVYAGIISNYEMTFDKTEVDSVYLVPIDWILESEPKGYVVDVVTIPREDFPFDKIPGGKNYPWKTGERRIYFYDHPDFNLWGFTATLISDFAKLARDVV